MKLSTVRIQQALDQLQPQTFVLSEDHPKAGELEEVFGQHTFFLDEDGLEIIEPVAREEEESLTQGDMGQVLRVAMWNDGGRTTLAAHPAELTGAVVVFPSRSEHVVDRAVEDSFPASDATSHSGITSAEDD